MSARIKVLSFGYKNGTPPRADLLFNVRFIDNPYHQPGMRDLTGEHSVVQTFVFQQECTRRFLLAAEALIVAAVSEFLLRGGDNFEEITIAFGCAGGRQRSVALALWCSNLIREYPRSANELRHWVDVEVVCSHRDLSVS